MEHKTKLPGDAMVHQQTGSDKRFHKPKSTLDPRLVDLIAHVEDHGYTIVHDAFSAHDVREARDTISRLSLEPHMAGPASQRGRNTFEGHRTQRLYALPNKSRVFDKFALHEDVLALNDYFLDPGYLLSTMHSINILPGEDAQTLHHDDGYVSVRRPRKPLSTAIMIALDGFTATNGATAIIPGSHKWGPHRTPVRSEARPAVMPSGSILYFLGTLYHGGGANNDNINDNITTPSSSSSSSDNGARLALTTQYCQPWLRPVENLTLAVDWDKLDTMPPRLVDMMGFKIGPPFVGHVNGKNPRAAVERKMTEVRGRGSGGGSGSGGRRESRL